MKCLNRSAVRHLDNPALVMESNLAVIEWSSADLQCISCSVELTRVLWEASCKWADSASNAGHKGAKRDGGTENTRSEEQMMATLMCVSEVKRTWLCLSARWTPAR